MDYFVATAGQYGTSGTAAAAPGTRIDSATVVAGRAAGPQVATSPLISCHPAESATTPDAVVVTAGRPGRQLLRHRTIIAS